MQSTCVIYCRVSTKEQSDGGTSLNFQEEVCSNYARENNLTVGKTFIEKGESAKTADRYELNEMLHYCTRVKNGVSAVLIYKIDRLSRNTDDYSSLRLFLKHYHIEIISVTEVFENNPFGRFMENLMANLAQFDNDIRTERVLNGMRQAVLEGRYIWQAPIGYSNAVVDGKANIKPNSKSILIKEAFHLIAYESFSPQQVLQTLHLPITRSQFYRLLHNPLYTGVINKFGLSVNGKFKPIIDIKTFEIVQSTIQRKKRVSRINLYYNPDFPLKRFVVNKNGARLTGYWSRGRHARYAYYRFQDCSGSFPKRKLENAFYTLLSNNVSSEIAELWLNGDINEKLKIQRDVFPNGVIWNKEKFTPIIEDEIREGL